MKKIYILTGPSGAGNSTVKFVFEELGFYIIENFPAVLTNDFLEKLVSNRSDVNDICLICRLTEAKALLLELKKHEEFKVIPILLDCDKEELMHRFTLTRHIHPNTIIANIDLEKAIDNDQKLVESLKDDAEIYVDTTKKSVKELRTILYNKIQNDNKEAITTVSFISFGMKYGIQKDIDMLIDCRILPNPYWDEKLREKTGLSKEVKDFINSFEETKIFFEKTIAYLEYHLAEMQKVGRGFYRIGVACSGGQHRSTFVADYLAKHFAKKYKAVCFHRDCPELNK